MPITNARYALNAANARWGSLYDALYGTDALAPPDPTPKPTIPGVAEKSSHGAARFWIGSPRWRAPRIGTSPNILWKAERCRPELGDGVFALAAPAGFAGYVGEASAPQILLLVHHGLHVEIHIDRAHPIGRTDPAGVSDIVLESALTAIQDCEDSVAAVDAEDKVLVYRNWLGLMTGRTRRRHSTRAAKRATRQLAPIATYTAPDGGAVTLPGRSLLLVRNVGHLMTSDAVLIDGEEAPEGLLDAHVHLPDRASRPARPRALAQQPRRIDLYRQAENART